MKRLVLGLVALAFSATLAHAIDIPGVGDPVDPGGDGQFFASSSADTTGAAATWIDTDGAVFSNANLYRHKALYILVSDGAASGKIVIRIQGSATGASTDFQDIITPMYSPESGATYLYTDTLQFVLPNTGAPFTVGRWIPMDSRQYFFPAGAADGAAAFAPTPLNAFPFLRAVVINRGADTITTTIRWLGAY